MPSSKQEQPHPNLTYAMETAQWLRLPRTQLMLARLSGERDRLLKLAESAPVEFGEDLTRTYLVRSRLIRDIIDSLERQSNINAEQTENPIA